MSELLDCLFRPLEMLNLKLKNRLFMAPMGTGYDIEKTKHYLTARARGGVSLITTGETSVHPSGRAGIKNELLVESDEDIKSLSQIAESVKKAGAKIVLQLNHAGRYSPGHAVGGQSVAPSPIMSGFRAETPRELSTTEVDDLVIAFAKAALRAREAGFDGVEFCGSSGYLISEFLSPLTNKRGDKYGGGAMSRATFILSILKEARKLVGPDFNICVKFDADDGIPGGIILKESMVYAPALIEAGADRLNVWAGWHESPRPMLIMTVPRGAFSYLSAEIKKIVSVPVAIAGRINDPYTAARIITNGEADYIGIARTLLSDPDFVKKTQEGRLKEIRKCTACCHCFDSILTRTGIPLLRCAINPELGREGEELIKKADKPKKIIIAGSGPAGLEAARVASIRGHKVTIYETDSKIGGMINLSIVPPHKDELKNILDYYAYQMELLGIELKLNTEFTINELNKQKPDAVILATGASTFFPDIPGINNNVSTALEVLNGDTQPGDSVIVIGGGMIGLETGEMLSEKGKKVTVIEMDRIASDIGPTSRWAFISRIRRVMKIFSSTRVTKILDNGVLVLDKDNNEQEIKADSIVLATGLKSNQELLKEVEANGIEYHLAGSCKKPGQIDDAISDGFNIGCMI